MRHLWRDLARALGWVWWSAAALLTALRWVDVRVVVPVLQSGLVLVGLTLLLLALLAGAVRAWRLLAVTAALGLVHLALAVPWWLDGSVPPGEDDVVVAMVNLEFGQGSVEDVAALVEEQDVDVLVLVEAAPATVEGLARTRLDQVLPHRTGSAREDAGGTLVLTKEPHDATPVTEGFVFDQALVRVGAGEQELTLVAAHPFPPVGLVAGTWRSELRGLGQLADAAGGGPVVLAGDLNASTGHPALRGLMADQGLADAHRVAGEGWVRSWPREAAIPAFVHIDHVLVRDLDVGDAGTWQVGGTDHLGVWARLRPEAGALGLAP